MMTIREAVQLLYTHGITEIIITYSGSGDSGDIENIEYFIKKKKIELKGIPPDPLKIADMVGKKAAASLENKKSKPILIHEQLPIKEIEGVLDSATNLIDGDWYNNEGGQGTITIDTKTMKVIINAEFNMITREIENQEVQL